MTKYEKGMIYKLVKKDDFDNNNIYIGSTCNIIKRRYYHKAACLNENNSRYNMKLYIFIRENGGWDNWIITPVESYPCNNKRELEIRERYYIETFKAKLNIVIPTRTDKEYKKYYTDKYKEKILYYNKKYAAEYRIKNKEKVEEYKKKRVICECGCEVSNDGISRHKKTDKHIKMMRK
jgi:hypothetical protein